VSTDPNYQYVITEVGAECPLTRDEIVAVLHEENVFARKYFYPGVHRMEPFRSLLPNAGRDLPVTECLTESVLALPTGTAVSEQEITRIGEIIACALEQRDEVRAALATRPKVPLPVPVLPRHMMAKG
jgi:dTDP-4-amino-4,6-dideoxygalactose transaminase